jgi:ribosome-binding protein aMBF1 (putative translation factor)
MECVLCGKEFQFLNKVEIEETILDVCDKCVTFGARIIEKRADFKDSAALIRA